MNSNNLRIGLALSGGSALGIAHIGVLQALTDHRIPISCISGTSAGAVVAAAYAFGVPMEEIAERAKNLSWYKLSNFSYSRMGLITTESVGLLIEEIVGKVNIEDAKIPLAIIATDIKNGDRVVFTKGNLAQAVMASVCIPGLFVPMQINGSQLVDGGLVENLPLSPLLSFGADIKIGVNLSKWRAYKKPENVIGVMLNAMDIMTKKQDNFHAQSAEILIEPHLEKYSTSDFKKAAELMNVGYRAAVLVMPDIQERLQNKPKSEIKKLGFFGRVANWLK